MYRRQRPRRRIAYTGLFFFCEDTFHAPAVPHRSYVNFVLGGTCVIASCDSLVSVFLFFSSLITASHGISSECHRRSLRVPSMPRKSCNKVMPPGRKPGRRTKVVYGRELNAESPSPKSVHNRSWPKYVPPSPPCATIRSLCHSGKKPSCLLFGHHHESLYTGYFFCSDCKHFENAVTSGTASKIKRDSK
jgi:hypothetical protein